MRGDKDLHRFIVALAKDAPWKQISGYDGTHYGPGMSHKIAEAVFAEFARRGLL